MARCTPFLSLLRPASNPMPDPELEPGLVSRVRLPDERLFQPKLGRDRRLNCLVVKRVGGDAPRWGIHLPNKPDRPDLRNERATTRTREVMARRGVGRISASSWLHQWWHGEPRGSSIGDLSVPARVRPARATASSRQ